MKKENVKGFKDFLGAEARKRIEIEKAIREEFELFGFEPAETPIVEYEEFVVGENKTDEAVRDVFRLKDRGKRDLALRYEFTFQLKRIAKNQKLPFKRYQIGSLFRDEPIREGRLRQFTQCDVDVVGSSLKDEAEIISITKRVFDKLNIPVEIYVNSRKLLNEILEDLKVPEMNREQAIREIDKLGKIPDTEIVKNLKKLKAEKFFEIVRGDEKSFEKYSSYESIKELKKYCKMYGCSAKFKPTLARGLSYYNGNVFEVGSKKLGVSLAGGGSFLVEDVQSTGISFGLEPLFIVSDVDSSNRSVLIVSLEKDKESIALADKLRENGINVQVLMDKAVGKAFEYANTKEFKRVIVVGKNEVTSNKFKVKDMDSGKEKEFSEKDLIKFLK